MTTHEFKAAGDHRRFRKRLILLLDGTWNDEDFGPADTNIVRLQEIIAKTLYKQEENKSKSPVVVEGDIARPLHDEFNFDNIVFYQRGVGTSWRDRYTGGVF